MWILRRPLKDEIQALSALLHSARDRGLVLVHGPVINRQAGSAFEVQDRFSVGDGGHLNAGSVLVGVVDRAAEASVLRGGNVHNDSLLRLSARIQSSAPISDDRWWILCQRESGRNAPCERQR